MQDLEHSQATLAGRATASERLAYLGGKLGVSEQKRTPVGGEALCVIAALSPRITPAVVGFFVWGRSQRTGISHLQDLGQVAATFTRHPNIQAPCGYEENLFSDFADLRSDC